MTASKPDQAGLSLLSRAEIRALAAIRLMSAGWRVESLDEEAVDALAHYAAGDRKRLDNLLTTAPFLARTERDTRIRRCHVARAAGDDVAIRDHPANMNLPLPSSGLATSPGRRGLGVAAAFAAIALTLWVAVPQLPGGIGLLPQARSGAGRLETPAADRPAPSVAPPETAKAALPSPLISAQALEPATPSPALPEPVTSVPVLSASAAPAELPTAPPSREANAAGPLSHPPADGAALVLVAEPGDTLPMLYRKVYRGLSAPAYAVVLANNRRRIIPGIMLVFPSPPAGWHQR